LGVQITVLGKSPSWQDAGGACSGYLVQAQGYTLVLDCGTGVFAKLRGAIDYFDVDAVLITHLHADHFFDLVPFSYALIHSPRRRQPGGPPALHAPPGARDTLRATIGAWGEAQLIETAFALREYEPETGLELGPLRARFCEVPHFTRTFAVELAGAEGRFTFSADCGPNDALVSVARDTDLLLLEATLLEPAPGHLSAREAGQHARRAGARRVVLTHYSDEVDSARVRADGSDGFGAPVELAREGAVYTL
jgi:ribonuclease BN (tRNA processing enzyme)